MDLNLFVQLNLVDLAGSERTKTTAVAPCNFSNGCVVNFSLLVPLFSVVLIDSKEKRKATRGWARDKSHFAEVYLIRCCPGKQRWHQSVPALSGECDRCAARTK